MEEHDLPQLDYATPPTDRWAPWKFVLSTIVLAVALLLSTGVVFAEGALMVQWASMKGVRMMCGNPRIGCQLNAAMLSIPLILSAAAWDIKFAKLSFLLHCLHCSQIIAVVALIAGVLWTQYY